MGSFVCMKIPVILRALSTLLIFIAFLCEFFHVIQDNWKNSELHTGYIYNILLYCESHYICKLNQDKQKNFHFLYSEFSVVWVNIFQVKFEKNNCKLISHSESLLKVGTIAYLLIVLGESYIATLSLSFRHTWLVSRVTYNISIKTEQIKVSILHQDSLIFFVPQGDMLVKFLHNYLLDSHKLLHSQ